MSIGLLMIYQRRNDILALLADGSICKWDGRTQAISPEIMCTDTVSVLKVCISPSIIAALTIDGRFLVGLQGAYRLEDKTAFIREILCHDSHDVIKGLYVFDHSILVNTEARICVIRDVWMFGKAINDISEFQASLYDIPSGINLISFNDGHGFLRTNDNILHSMGCNVRWQLGVPYHDQVRDSNKPRPSWVRYPYKLHIADFDDTENIREIVCGYLVTLFLMKNGSVRAGGAVVRGSEYEHSGVYFSQLEFPEGVHIAKIATGHLLIMFASTDGQCYCMDVHDRAQAIPNGFIPILVEPLAGHYVENMFVFNEFVIILYDGGKVCALWLSRSCIERRRLTAPNQYRAPTSYSSEPERPSLPRVFQ